MGCGGSKLDPDSDRIPARVQPLLRRRFEEMKRRRNKGKLKDSSPSKKELLIAGGSEEDSSQERDYDRKSGSSDHEESLKVAPDPEPSNEKIIKCIEVDKASGTPSLTVSPEEATNPESAKPCIDIAQNKPVEGSPQASPASAKDVAPAALPVTTPATESDESRNERSTEKNDTEMATAVVEVAGTTDDEESEDSEDDEERALRRAEGFNFCPGSPSFRVFLRDSLPNAKEDSESDDDKEDDTDEILQSDDNDENKISQSEDGGENVEIESSNSNQGLVTKTKKNEGKGKRGRKFRKVMQMPKGRLLHVNMKSCYNPARSGSQDNASLLSQKVA